MLGLQGVANPLTNEKILVGGEVLLMALGRVYMSK